MFVRLADIKSDLGIGDTSRDAELTGYIKSASAAIRSPLRRWLGSSVESIVGVDATTASVTVFSHGLKTGDQVRLSITNSTPVLDDDYTITRTSRDTFTIPITSAVTAPATEATLQRLTTLYSEGNDRDHIHFPLDFAPVADVTEVAVDDNGFFGKDTTDHVAFGTGKVLNDYDYALEDETRLVRRHRCWPQPCRMVKGSLKAWTRSITGNIRAKIVYGLDEIPDDIIEVCHALIAMKLGEQQGIGGLAISSLPSNWSSLSYEGFSIGRNSSGTGSAAGSGNSQSVGLDELGTAQGLLGPYMRIIV